MAENDDSPVPWYERAARDLERRAGPSGPGWNVSSVLDALRSAKLEDYCSRENGDAGDALDYALDHVSGLGFDPTDFLEDWRSGDLSEWPDYRRWLAAQHEGARDRG